MSRNNFLLGILILVGVLGIDNVMSKDIERKDNFDERGEFYQGDMRLAPGTLQSIKSGIIGDQYRWPNNLVIYWLNPGWTIDELNIIQAALEEISANTCIKFAQRTDQVNYVNITREMDGCWSWVGRIQGMQELNLQPGSPGCISKGIAIHELLHAIGFFHEHSRTDRDDYVEIIWDNIQPGFESNFEIEPNSEGYGIPYDYGSVMHYSAFSFPIDPSMPTIIPKDENVDIGDIGQRVGMSQSDIDGVNLMYNCPSKK